MEPLPNPFHVAELDDATLEGAVFPQDVAIGDQRPYLLMFYSPGCGHCRQILPIFNNASVQLEATLPEWESRTARLAVVDVITNKRLAALYKIRAYPTFFYTINGRAHRFHAPHVLESFMKAAVRIRKASVSGGFSTDVTDPARFAVAAGAQSPRDPWFILCRPSAANGEAARTFVDSVYSHGSSFFAHVVESEAPPLSQRPAIMPPEGSHERSYWAVRDACADAHARERASEGPGGEALLLWADKTALPMLYGGGPWGGDADSGVHPFISSKGADTFWTSRRISMFVWEHSLNSIEVLTPDVLGAAAKRSRLGVIVTDGPIDLATDKQYYPAVLALSQRRHAAFVARTPSAKGGVVFEHLDGSTEENFERAGQAARMWLRTPTQFLFADRTKYKSWLDALGVGGDATPNFFALDVNKGTIWRIDEWAQPSERGLLAKAAARAAASAAAESSVAARADGGAASAASVVLAPNGPEMALIDRFLDEVEGVTANGGGGNAGGAAGGEGMRGAASMTSYGPLARFLVNYVPTASWLMAAVGDDDLIFLIVIAATIGWAGVAKVALRPQAECDGAGTPLLGRKHV